MTIKTEAGPAPPGCPEDVVLEDLGVPELVWSYLVQNGLHQTAHAFLRSWTATTGSAHTARLTGSVGFQTLRQRSGTPAPAPRPAPTPPL